MVVILLCLGAAIRGFDGAFQRPVIHHRDTEVTEKFKSFLCREMPAKERYVSGCGARF